MRLRNIAAAAATFAFGWITGIIEEDLGLLLIIGLMIGALCIRSGDRGSLV